MSDSQNLEPISSENEKDFVRDQKIYIAKQPLFKYTKYLLRIGYVVGVCPLQNVFTGKGFKDMTPDVISFDYLLSLVLYIYKATATLQLWVLLFEMDDSPMNLQRGTTDMVAGTIGFTFTFCFGIMAHVMSVGNLKNYLRAVRQIETSDKEFPIQESDSSRSIFMVKFQMLRFISSFLTTAIMIYTPVKLAYKVTFQNPDHPDILLLPGIHTANKFIIFIYLTFAFIIREIGVTFCYFQLFTLTGHLEYRLRYMIRLVEVKCLNEKEHTSWASMSRQYTGFVEMIETYQKFATSYFLILFSTGMISSVCMIYIRSNPTMATVPGAFATLDFVLCVTLSRIVFLADCGELFQKKSRILLKAVMMVSLTQNGEDTPSDTESDQFKGLLKIMTTNKVDIRAGGFFVVSRKNITSIISVIITYVLVLLQFRYTDTSGANQLDSYLKNRIVEPIANATGLC